MGGVPGGRFQVGLRDLAVAVLGSAFVLDVARRSRLAWGGGPPDLAHALGMAVLGLAVALGIVVATRRSRGLRVGDGPASPGARAFALAWRASAVGWLAGSVAEAAWILQDDAAAPAIAAGFGPPNPTQVRLDVVPICLALGMIGLILAASPARARRSGPGPARAAWPSVIWAGLAGVVILAIGYAALPYLVLLALEAVANAMRRAPLIPRAAFHDRMVRAGLEALAVGLAGLATASWIAEDLRAALRDPVAARESRSRPGLLARLATAAATAIGGLYLLLAAIPRLDPRLAEGFEAIVDPTLGATIALAFAVLAAGSPPGVRSPWRSRRARRRPGRRPPRPGPGLAGSSAPAVAWSPSR